MALRTELTIVLRVCGMICELLQSMIAVLLCLFLLSSGGCAGLGSAIKRPQAAADQKEQDATPVPAEEELSELVLPQKSQESPGQKQKLYTLQMRDAQLQDLLFAFSGQTGLNIVIDPNITGTVTVDLKRVTLEQALDTILTPLGLEYARQGNMIKVFRPALETRIFKIDYITTIRTGKGLISGAIGGKGSGSSFVGTDAQGGGRETGSGGLSQVMSEDRTDLWTTIEAELNNLKSPDGKITVTKISNSVVVTDYPRILAKIAEFLETIESSVQRQVLIEASIIEVTLNDKYQAGVNWGRVQTLPQMSNWTWGMATRGPTEYLGYPGSTGGRDTGDGSSSSTQTIPARIKIRPFSGLLTIGTQGQSILLTDIVEALDTQGDVNILSSPRITTLNNQPAIMKVAREDVYFQTTRTVTAGESTTESNVNFLTVGIVLSVTPQISADGIITMTIHPSITEKAGEKLSSLGDSVPIVDVRETETVARVRNNETILIGGLMQDKVTEDNVGIPLLQDIPLLGNLFKHINREKKKTELVIMLTPRIMNNETIETISAAARAKVDALRAGQN